jgi:hypothetical protein
VLWCLWLCQEALEASNRLYQQATKLRVKQEQRLHEAPDGCTFVPKVTSKARKTGVATGQERFEHLFRNAAATQQKLDQKREKVRALVHPSPRVCACVYAAWDSRGAPSNRAILAVRSSYRSHVTFLALLLSLAGGSQA